MRAISAFVLLAVAGVGAQTDGVPAEHVFGSGGTVRLHLEAGGYTIRPTDAERIAVTYHTDKEEQAKRVKVEIRAGGSTADVFVRETPRNNFEAVIEVPRKSNLWVRLSAGELDVKAVEGDKDLEMRAGELRVEVPSPESYGHRDASVLSGSIEASAFHVSKGGLLRSFEQEGGGKYRLHAHLMAGEIQLKE